MRNKWKTIIKVLKIKKKQKQNIDNSKNGARHY